MRTVNKVILVGAAGSDPDVRITPGGRKEARMTLATTAAAFTDHRDDWHRVVLFDRHAQVAEDYVSKGDLVYVEGYLQYGSFERDGVTVPTMEIIAREMVLLERNGAHQ